nr:GTP-binding protein [Olegusella massiliensis]
MKILVVSGCLGAGKTTFIQELLRRTGKDAVIYENEYGEADIDARRLRADSDLQVWESVENCICCSGKQDFASSVLTISNTLDPEYLIVEPTGVARLGNVLDNLSQVEWERISQLAPVVVVDALSWVQQRQHAQQIFDDQIIHAATVIVSKLGTTSDADAIHQLVEQLNPQAEFVALPYKNIPDEWWSRLFLRGRTGTLETSDANHAESPEFETMALEHVELPSPTHLIWLLDALSAGVFGKLARAKGTVNCGNQKLRFDLVERSWAISGIEDTQEETRCVFIGEELLRSGLRETFVPALWQKHAELRHEHHHAHDEHEHHHSHNK